MKPSGETLTLLGLLLMIGTVGACELSRIGIGQTVIQCLAGLAMMKVGLDIINRRKETEE